MKKTNQQLVAEFCQSEGIYGKLVYIENIDTFAHYQLGRGYYKIIDDQKYLQRMMFMYLMEHAKEKNITEAMVKDALSISKYLINDRVEHTSTPYIGVSDETVFNKDTFEFEPRTTNTMAFTKMNVPYNPDVPIEPPTRFLQFLNEVIVQKDMTPDVQMQSLIQELFGYCLLNTLESHASFFMVGGGANGKSVLLNTLRAVVGEEYCSSTSIEALTTNDFAASQLVAKLLNVCMEEESSFVRSDKFKALVSGDPITVQRKYQTPFTWKPTVKYVFATNDMPTFTGFNEGLLRRIIIVNFNRKFKIEEQDTKLTAKLQSEIPQITWWALEGAKRLQANNYHFSLNERTDKKAAELGEHISSAVLFLNERFTLNEIDPQHSLFDDLYDEYVIWAQKRGKKTMNYYNFKRDLLVRVDVAKIPSTHITDTGIYVKRKAGHIPF